MGQNLATVVAWLQSLSWPAWAVMAVMAAAAGKLLFWPLSQATRWISAGCALMALIVWAKPQVPPAAELEAAAREAAQAAVGLAQSTGSQLVGSAEATMRSVVRH